MCSVENTIIISLLIIKTEITLETSLSVHLSEEGSLH